MTKFKDNISLAFYRIIMIFSLIIIFISIAQLSNENDFGYKNLEIISRNTTSDLFKKDLNKRISFSKGKTIVNLLFNILSYFYLSMRLNPNKHINHTIFTIISLILFAFYLIELILNCKSITDYKEFDYDHYFIENDLNKGNKEIFENLKKKGKENLKMDSAIVAFVVFKIVCFFISAYFGCEGEIECKYDCFTIFTSYFISNISLDEENSSYNNNINNDNSNLETRIYNLKNEIEKIKEEKKKLKTKITNLEQNIQKYKKEKIELNKDNNKFKQYNNIIKLIKYYINKKYRQEIPSNSILDIFIKEINKKFKENINKNQLKKFRCMYVQDKLNENLICPISADRFINPVITPEGQTFDKNKIETSLDRNKINPITKKPLKINQLVLNKKILELLELSQNYADNFDDIACQKLKEILKDENGRYYTNPIVVSSGTNIGNTIEGNSSNKNYKNLIIKALIDEVRELLDENFETVDEIKIKNINTVIRYQRNEDIINSEDTSII